MKKYIDQPCSEYIEVLASSAPVPGGGGTSALVGAIGMALGNMVGGLTVGKKKYMAVEDEIKSLMAQGETLMDELKFLCDEDPVVFEPLSKAYGLPAGTEEEKRHKEEVMEGCLKAAAEVPAKIMEKCCEAIDLMENFAHNGSRLAVSDAGVGAVMCKAALKGASLNVFINTKSMKDRAYAEALNEKCEKMIEIYGVKADEIFDYVNGELK